MTNELYEKHCWALVDLDAMQSNLALIKKTVGAPVCCVVKADAYGHGAAVAGPWLEENGAAAFAVSCLAEARHLRRHGISKPILILGYTDPLQVDQLAFNCITQTVYSEEYAKALSAAAQNAGVEVHCHFKVDTGMGRIGFSVRSDFEAAIDAMERCAAEGLRNVRFIDANANILPEFFAPGEVDRIYINFCDPWPTKRHAKRRLTHGNFLKLYRKVLKDGGQIHFKTDNAPLFAWSVEEIPQFGFTLSEVTDDLHANGAVGVMTDYEAKFHELGTPIHRLVATMTPWEEPEEE